MHQRGDRGFTLMEVLVALAVLAIALAGVMRLSAQTIDATVYLHDKTLALWVAQNRIAEHIAQQNWPGVDTIDGDSEMGGQKWFWREQVSATGNPKIRKIKMTVRRAAKGEDSLAQLTGFVHDPN